MSRRTHARGNLQRVRSLLTLQQNLGRATTVLETYIKFLVLWILQGNMSVVTQ
jgi:hypothetical protein